MRWVAKVNDGKLELEGIGCEESGAAIHALDDGTFDLYEHTQFGMAELYDGNYANINEAIKVAESWT